MTLKARPWGEMSPEEFNRLYPVVGVQLYKSGIRLVRVGGKASARPKRPRKAIVKMSTRSLSNLIWMAANTSAKFGSMLTLTYGKEYPVDGRQVKKHLNHFITTFRRRRGKFDYLWVMEFQGRGAPHLHVLTTLPGPADGRDRATYAAVWTRTVLGSAQRPYSDLKSGHVVDLSQEMYRVHLHRSSYKELWSEDGALRYVAKYAAKLEQKTPPPEFLDTGRFWGASYEVSRGVRPIATIPIVNQSEVERVLIDIGRDDLLEWPIIPSKIVSYL